jgi:hypothetical protein
MTVDRGWVSRNLGAGEIDVASAAGESASVDGMVGLFGGT